MTEKTTVPVGYCQCGCGQKTKLNRQDNPLGLKGQPRRFVQGHSSRATRQKFLPFAEARAFVQSLGIRGRDGWRQYCASGKKPENIPADPGHLYEEFNGYCDWLGTKTLRFRGRGFLPFGEAREFARSLRLTSGAAWFSYCRSGKKPKNIPTAPTMVYPEQWRGWKDWLNNGLKPFIEARNFARSLNFRSSDEWFEYCRSGQKPRDIPSAPSRVYPKDWSGWADWLGYLGADDSNWTALAIRAFLKSLASEIPNMRDASLVALITEAGLAAPLMQLLETPSLALVIAALREDADRIQRLLQEQGEARFDIRELEIAEQGEFAHDEFEVDANNIHVADRLKGKVSLEFIDHLVQERVSALLVKFINGSEAEMRKILNQQGGEFFKEIKQRFESEIRGVMDVDASCWKLRDQGTGKPTQPNLMQRFIAHKMVANRVWCNWSGTGAGKTGSAGLAAYATNSQLTVVLCPNSTVQQWGEALKATFPDSRTAYTVADVKRGRGSFLIFNYEQFQSRRTSRSLLQSVVALRPNLIVLDEVQLIKRREHGGCSIRRETLEALLRALPQARILGMTATPVINELREGVSLLEAVTGKPQNLRTKGRGAGAVLDALNLHFALLQRGLRYKPPYQQTLSVQPRTFTKNELLPTLKNVAMGGSDVLAIERAILPAKLENVRNYIRPGTLIYLEFVQGLVPIVTAFVRSLGLKVGEYTGDTATLERTEIAKKFVAGEIDVLIGSRAIGLGVDGLQARCNRLIMLSLPWTHAAFEQVVGRVYRQGSNFAEVEVVIPQAVTDIGGEHWSWDEARYAVIQHKKTISDAATDGYVPTSEHVSRKEFAKKAMDALKLMLERTKIHEDSENPELSADGAPDKKRPRSASLHRVVKAGRSS